VTPLHQPQDGFTLGGPIVRDRAFFFGSYEYQKASITNRPSTGLAQFDVNVAAPQTRHLVSGRVDAQLNSKNRLFFRTNPFKELRLNEGIGTKVTANAGTPALQPDGVIGETCDERPSGQRGAPGCSTSTRASKSFRRHRATASRR
jgi:hypothetical protein